MPIRSIWGSDAENVFFVVDVMAGTTNWDTKIYEKNGASWDSMTLPSYLTPMRLTSIWGYSASEIYAVGGQIDSVGDWIDAVLWRYNGSSWTEITTLPSDVVTLADVHGNDDGEIVVVGATHDGSDYHGVVLVTNDLVNWNRSDTVESVHVNSIWSPRLGAAIAGGSAPTPPLQGAARMSESSEGSWTESSLDSTAEVVSGIWPVVGTDQMMLATYSDSQLAALYTGTCQ
jgi:hypothetical protein